MKRFHAPGRQAGFSLLEVLIAVLVLGFGLLGFALLQTMSVRFVQGANNRTRATTLAYDLTEQMRANRHHAAWYAAASFAPGSQTAAAVCQPPTGEAAIARKIAAWQCQVVKALGDDAGAQVTYTDGAVQIAITWGDQRWDPDDPDRATTFSLETRI